AAPDEWRADSVDRSVGSDSVDALAANRGRQYEAATRLHASRRRHIMAEVLAEFADPVACDGVAYRAQAWIEFLPIGGGPAIRTARETTQPNFTDAQYWASGLTHVYLEGALSRALN